MKKCSKCKKLKPLCDFKKEKLGKDGIRASCKICDKKRLKKWRKQNPIKVKHHQIKNKLGLSQENFNLMFEKQEGKCFICETHQFNLKRSLHVDHCHTTGKIRSLLCHYCNTALGLVKENTLILKRMIQYIEENET